MARRVLTKKGKAVRWEGIPELQKRVDSLLSKTGHKQGQQIGKEIKRVLMGAALVIRDEAKDLVPKDTGLLESAIFAAYGDDRKPNVLVGVNTQIAVKTTASGKTKTYAGVVEFGDASHPAQPFMRPAITAARPKAANVVADGLKQVLREIV